MQLWMPAKRLKGEHTTANQYKYNSLAPTLQNRSDKAYSIDNSYKTLANIQLLNASETLEKQKK